jgi:hypothetical protein
MTKPISDKAEVAVEYPDKLYIGTFAHTARFDAHLDQSGIALTLELPGPDEQRKSVHMHFHYALFAEILARLGENNCSFTATRHPAPRSAARFSESPLTVATKAFDRDEETTCWLSVKRLRCDNPRF